MTEITTTREQKLQEYEAVIAANVEAFVRTVREFKGDRS